MTDRETFQMIDSNLVNQKKNVNNLIKFYYRLQKN